jgi:hypothetical protein
MEAAPETDTSIFSLSIAANKTFFRLAEVPWLTALAIHGKPVSPNPLMVVKLEKGTEDWRYREPLNATDMESLGIHDKSLPLIFSDWMKLEEKIKNSNLLQALRIIPIFYTLNPERESGLVKVHKAHCERLREMLMAKNLVAKSLATGLETEITFAYFAHYKNLAFDDPVIPLREFKKFARALEIGIKIGNHSEVGADNASLLESKSDFAKGQPWTPERLEAVKTYRDTHGATKTAEHFGISSALIRRKLPTSKAASKNSSPLGNMARALKK